MVIAWSLSVEEWFYFLFPIFLIIFNKLSIEKIFIFILLIIYSLKLLFLFNFNDGDFYRTGTFLRLDAILFGAMIAHYFEVIKKFKYSLVALIITFFIFFYFKNILTNEINFAQFIYVALIQLISIFSIIFFIQINPIINLKYLNGLYSILANQTYSVYLFHFIFIYFIKFYNLQNINFIFIYYILSLFIFSYLVFYLIEKSILKLRPNYN